MSDLPYPIPAGVIEPGDGDPGTRLMGRITAGTAYARALPLTQVRICLNTNDFALYASANSDIPGAKALVQSTCDGAVVEQLAEGTLSVFTGRDQADELIIFPLMSDAQYLSALSLKPGMFVVREGDLTPRELLRDPLSPGVLRVGLHRYDTKGRTLKHNVPAILYAWDKQAMEDKADRNEMTQMEKAFFSMVIQHQMKETWIESLAAVRQ